MRASVTSCAVWLALAVPAARAELSATDATSAVAIVQISAVAEPSSQVWSQVRAIAPELILNVDGVPRGDHSPAIGVNPSTGFPEVVWCYWDGNDTEIAWSRFNGQSWSAPELITTNAVDDEAPSLAFDVDGASAIAWESHTTITRIEYRERQNSGAWSPVIHVSEGSDDAGSPHVVQHQGRIKVGYIQPETGAPRAVKVASSEFDPNPWPAYFTPELIAMISFSGDIAPELHSYPDQLFTTWVNSSNEIGFARFDGTTWQTPQTETYTSAEDLPKARIRAKTRALHGP